MNINFDQIKRLLKTNQGGMLSVIQRNKISRNNTSWSTDKYYYKEIDKGEGICLSGAKIELEDYPEFPYIKLFNTTMHVYEMLDTYIIWLIDDYNIYELKFDNKKVLQAKVGDSTYSTEQYK